MILAIIVPKTTLSQSVVSEKAILDYKIDTGIRLHTGLVRKFTHGQIEKDIVQWVYDNFDTLGTGSGFNLSNHSLTANGSYNHNWNNYPIAISNISQLIFQDTFTTIAYTLDSLFVLGTISKGIEIDRSTGIIMIDSAYYLPTTAGGSIGSVLQTTSTHGTAFLPITRTNLISNYNGTSTAGNGLYVIRSHSHYKNRVSAIVITSFTAPIDGVYVISGYLGVNSITGTLKYKIDFTDQNGNPQTYTFTDATTTGMQPINSTEINVQGSTLISISTVLVSGIVDYDCSATITQVD